MDEANAICFSTPSGETWEITAPSDERRGYELSVVTGTRPIH